MAATGVVLLTILSVIPDIIEHHADLIVRAEHEVFLATNFWEASGAASTICDAMKELSRRVVEAGRPKVVFKLMYDRGNPKQVAKKHLKVEEKEWTGKRVDLPALHEIPGLDLEVVNYHDPPVGTFHAKYMVVDRKYALLNSNNIQVCSFHLYYPVSAEDGDSYKDRVNVEMMIHLEGPIVQGFYDMALISWSESMKPQLPLLTQVLQQPVYDYVFGDDHPVLTGKGSGAKAEKSRAILQQHLVSTSASAGAVAGSQTGAWDASDADEATRVNSGLLSESAITTHLSECPSLTNVSRQLKFSLACRHRDQNRFFRHLLFRSAFQARLPARTSRSFPNGYGEPGARRHPWTRSR